MTKEEWNSIYFTVIPLLGVGALGVVIGLIALERSQAQAGGVGSLGPTAGPSSLDVNIPRVHYDNDQVFVEVRNPGEWHELRDFVQPTNRNVIQIVRSL